MEKRAVISQEDTPPEPDSQPMQKRAATDEERRQIAEQLKQHPTWRLTDAAAEAVRRSAK